MRNVHLLLAGLLLTAAATAAAAHEPPPLYGPCCGPEPACVTVAPCCGCPVRDQRGCCEKFWDWLTFHPLHRTCPCGPKGPGRCKYPCWPGGATCKACGCRAHHCPTPPLYTFFLDMCQCGGYGNLGCLWCGACCGPPQAPGGMPHHGGHSPYNPVGHP
jgi:hypothetical protein